jgi:quinol monooxygenase YgiN
MRSYRTWIVMALLSCGVFGGASQWALAAEDSVTLVARFYAAPGREAEVADRFGRLVAFVRKAEPHITYRLYRSEKDPSVFIFYEVHPSKQARDDHVNVHVPAFLKEAGPPPEGLFAKPSEREFLKVLVD